MIKDFAGKDKFTLDVKASDTIGKVKLMIKEEDDIPPDLQRLILGDAKDMEDGHTLSDYNIQKDCFLILALRLRGGGGNHITVDTGSLLF